MSDFVAMKEALVENDRDKLVGLVEAAINNDVPAGAILNEGLISAMDTIGSMMRSWSVVLR